MHAQSMGRSHARKRPQRVVRGGQEMDSELLGAEQNGNDQWDACEAPLEGTQVSFQEQIV